MASGPLTNSERITLERFFTTLMDANDKRYEQRFIAMEKATLAMISAADNALSKADATAVRDKAAANEWRAAMNDREKLFIARPEFAAEISNLQKKIEDLAGTRLAGMSAAWGIMLGAGGILISLGTLLTLIVTIFLKVR